MTSFLWILTLSLQVSQNHFNFLWKVKLKRKIFPSLCCRPYLNLFAAKLYKIPQFNFTIFNYLQMLTSVGPVACIFLTILFQYFSLTNFCWMLVEGRFCYLMLVHTLKVKVHSANFSLVHQIDLAEYIFTENIHGHNTHNYSFLYNLLFWKCSIFVFCWNKFN